MEKVAYLFAGQGSQYVGMGKDLYATFPESKSVFDKADKVLGFTLSELCFEGPQEELTLTYNCQPAILAVSIAALEAFRSVLGTSTSLSADGECSRTIGSPSTWPERSRRPSLGTSRFSLDFARDKSVLGYVAGLSLGEYSALVAAGSLDFEDAIFLVRRRGELMEEEARKHPGKMLSIIGLDLEKVREVCFRTDTEIANINCPGQIVISGSPENTVRAGELASELGAKRAIFLEVSGAFHSSSMKEVSLKLAEEFKKININEPFIPVVSNVSASAVNSPTQIKENLINQVTSSVLWENSMRFILSKGISKFFEFGPGKVLKGLMRRIDENAEVVNIERKEDIFRVASKE